MFSRPTEDRRFEDSKSRSPKALSSSLRLAVKLLLSSPHSEAAGKPGSLPLARGVFIMEMPGLPIGSRRDEDIALDLMKFIAMTTSYGKTTGAGVGFQGTGAAAKPEDYAAHLLELYGRCLQSVGGK
jgi:hypothetical protein